MTDAMTPGDRRILIGIIKQRERVAKSDAAKRSAELMADFDAQLEREFSFDENETWKKAVEKAEAAVAQAVSQIAEECKRLGIPDEFAPTLHLTWKHQGYFNTTKEARAKLRTSAQLQIQSAEKAAKAEIERQSVALQERVVIGGLETEEARSLLAEIPAADKLMPALTVDQVKALPAVRS